MMRAIKLLITAVIAAQVVLLPSSSFSQGTTMYHQNVNGQLTREPTAAYFDFQYLTTMTKSVSHFALEQKLQSRFMWHAPVGMEGQRIVIPQHAVVAFTQRSVENLFINGEFDFLWSHGVGAVVGEYGLGLEFWYQHNGQTNGIIWTQASAGCALDVLGTLGPGSMCLCADPATGSYLTAAPQFKLRYGVFYWVRITVSPHPTVSSLRILKGELLEETSAGPVLVQSGQVGFYMATMLPGVGPENVYPVVARTPGSEAEQIIYFNAFNFGF